MVIWSILTQQAWEELQRKGRLRASAFEKKLARASLSLLGCSHQKPLPHATLRREIEKSWERIFDLSWTDPGHKIVSSAKDRSIQRTLWELLLEDIVESKEFVAR